MTLQEYLATNQIKPAELARDVGIAASMVTRFLRGERGLSLDVAVRIEAHTNHVVTCADLSKPALTSPDNDDEPAVPNALIVNAATYAVATAHTVAEQAIEVADRATSALEAVRHVVSGRRPL